MGTGEAGHQSAVASTPVVAVSAIATALLVSLASARRKGHLTFIGKFTKAEGEEPADEGVTPQPDLWASPAAHDDEKLNWKLGLDQPGCADVQVEDIDDDDISSGLPTPSQASSGQYEGAVVGGQLAEDVRLALRWAAKGELLKAQRNNPIWASAIKAAVESVAD